MLGHLQLSLAQILIVNGVMTLQDWKDTLCPYLSSSSIQRVWIVALNTTQYWQKISKEKRIATIFTRLDNLDVQEAFESLNVSQEHPSVAMAIAAVRAQTGPITKCPFPQLMFPGSPIAHKGGVDGPLAHIYQKDFSDKADQLKQANLLRNREQQRAL
ncbi:unnamed protein product [Parajaminaea phylloscopi]